MPIIHNQINKLWFKPSYIKFKKSGFVNHIFTNNDASDFIHTGAYLIKEAEKLSRTHIPWDESRRLEILKNPRLENAFISLGAEYLTKGIFLYKGYSINKPIQPVLIRLIHPVQLKGNKNKLDTKEVQEFNYILTHLPKLVDYGDFDKKQKDDEKEAKNKNKGDKLDRITRMTIPYPDHKALLDYLLFKRNYSLHRPFIMPEFVGITNHIFNFLEYTVQKITNKSLDELAKMTS